MVYLRTSLPIGTAMVIVGFAGAWAGMPVEVWLPIIAGGVALIAGAMWAIWRYQKLLRLLNNLRREVKLVVAGYAAAGSIGDQPKIRSEANNVEAFCASVERWLRDGGYSKIADRFRDDTQPSLPPTTAITHKHIKRLADAMLESLDEIRQEWIGQSSG